MSGKPLNNAMIEEVTHIFHALGDPSRLKLLRRMMESPGVFSQNALMDATGLSQANTSKHLVCLVRTGLVRRERKGNVAYFSLAGPLVPNICRLVKEHVMNRSRLALQSLA